MAVIVTAQVAGQTKEGYDAMMATLGPIVQAAPGFILTAAYEDVGEWRVIEIWETQKQASEFFARYVHPNLPPGIKPRRTMHELHVLVRP
jgi:hypothetical protein